MCCFFEFFCIVVTKLKKIITFIGNTHSFGGELKNNTLMKLSGKIIAKLLTLCGISLTCTACYAMPSTDFTLKSNVKGTVTDEGNPIEGIKVTVKSSADSKNSIGNAMTIATGNYRIFSDSDIEVGWAVTVEDIDGDANGGDFETQTKIVTAADLGDNVEAVTVDFELEPKTVNPE
jgi:putative lipoprotein (rSAM/lipoprotein system)